MDPLRLTWPGMLRSEVTWKDAPVHLPPQAMSILALLAVCRGSWVSHARLFELLWGGDPEGGALTYDNVIRVRISLLRRLLPGLPLMNSHREGYQLGLPEGQNKIKDE